MDAKTKSASPRILLVDDDTDLLHLIGVRLRANGYDVNAVDNAGKALAQLSIYKPHVVVTDLLMSGMDGMALFEAIQRKHAGLPVIILTANGTIPDAVTAAQKGVFAYVEKPFEANVLLGHLENALKHGGDIFPSAASVVTDGEAWRKDIISRSAVMDAVLRQTKAAAASELSILIQGQTGTGKELLAAAIHNASSRRDKPFVALNCAAIPEALLESELFGHVTDSSTQRTRPGAFQSAHGGTLFLDAIGDMPLTAQSSLLHVLEQHEVRAVGATQALPIDVRIVAATQHDLGKRVAEGSFREELYYRLNVMTLELPPLSKRREDILLLVEHFCQVLAERNDKAFVRFSPTAAQVLVSAPWPGNVRQLYNVVEQCVVLATTPLISSELVERTLRFKPDKLLGLNDAREQFEHDYLVRLLNLTEGNIALAARLSERNRSEFYNLLKRHGLDPAQFRKNWDDPPRN